MRPRHDAKFLRPHDAGKAHEISGRGLVDPARAGVAEIGEPLDLWRYVGQAAELGCRQQSRSTGGGNLGRKLFAGQGKRGRMMVPGGTPASSLLASR